MNKKFPFTVGTTYYKTIEKPLEFQVIKFPFCFDGIRKPLSATVEKIIFHKFQNTMAFVVFQVI